GPAEKAELLRGNVEEGFGIPLRASWDELPHDEIPGDDARLRPHWAMAVTTVGAGVMLALISAFAYLGVVASGVSGLLHDVTLWFLTAAAGAIVGMVVAWRSWPAHRYTHPVVPAVIGLTGGVLFTAGLLLVVGLLRGL